MARGAGRWRRASSIRRAAATPSPPKSAVRALRVGTIRFGPAMTSHGRTPRRVQGSNATRYEPVSSLTDRAEDIPDTRVSEDIPDPRPSHVTSNERLAGLATDMSESGSSREPGAQAAGGPPFEPAGAACVTGERRASSRRGNRRATGSNTRRARSTGCHSREPNRNQRRSSRYRSERRARNRSWRPRNAVGTLRVAAASNPSATGRHRSERTQRAIDRRIHRGRCTRAA